MRICGCINPRPEGCEACNSGKYQRGFYEFTPIQTGWICPRCQSVMSPTSPQCWNCKPIARTPVETLSLCPHGCPVKLNNCALCNAIPCANI